MNLLANRVFQRAATNAEGERFACIATADPVEEVSYNWETGRFERNFNSLDLAGMRAERLDNGIQLLRDHSSWTVGNIFGVTSDYEVRGNQLLADFDFSSDPEKAGIVSDVEAGIIRNFSISFAVHRRELIEEIDGVNHYRITDWEPLEVSLVTIGADPQATRRSMLETLVETMSKKHDDKTDPKAGAAPAADQTARAKATEGGGAAAAGDDSQRGVSTQESGADQAPAVTRKTTTTVVEEGTLEPTGGNEDTLAPKTPVKRESVSRFMEAAKGLGFDAEHAVKAYDRGISFEEYAIELVKEGNPKMTGRNVQVESGQAESEKFIDGARQAVLHQFKPGKYEIENGNEFRGYSLMDLIDESLDMKGIARRGKSKDDRIKMALGTYQREGGGLHTTSDFPILMAAIVNTVMRDGYREEDQTFQAIANRATNVDFRLKQTINLGEVPDLLRVPEDGEYKRGTFSERGESYKLDTYGRIVGLTRQLIINDQTGEILSVIGTMSRAVSRLQSDVVWGAVLGYNFERNAAAPVLLSDGNPVFDAVNHQNFVVGGASALSIDSLREARTRGRRQNTLDGKRAAPVVYDTLVVPPELEGLAEQLVQLQFNPQVRTEATPAFIRSMNVVVERRLEDDGDAAALSRWYLVDSSQPELDYAFLSGEQEIFNDQRIGFHIDGIEWKIRTDFGAGWRGHRGWIRYDGV